MKNKYAGICHSCGKVVNAGEGIYDTGFGKLVCSELITKDEVQQSLVHHIDNPYGFMCLDAFNIAAGTHFATGRDVRVAQEIERNASLPSAEQIAANQAAAKQAMKEDAKRRRAELADFKKRNICPRCHGKGGSDEWQMTGWTCNRCHGSGKFQTR